MKRFFNNVKLQERVLTDADFQEHIEENIKDNYDNLEPIDIDIDNHTYTFLESGTLFSIFSNLLYLIAYPILTILDKLLFNLKIKGRENIKAIKGAKITVSQHIQELDCTMVGLANRFQKTYFTALEDSFKIPVVGGIMRLLNAIPIPKDIKYTRTFMNGIDNLLKQGKTVHIYPEGSLVSYSEKIRPFKDGAFDFAVRNNVPIVPLTFKYEEPTGIRKHLKSHPFLSLYVLPAEYPDLTLSKPEAVKELKNRVYEKMNFRDVP